MNGFDAAEDRALVAGWFAAASLPAIDAALRGLFDGIADAIRRQRPLCLASGRCCHFETFGHRLYVTGLETAWTVRQLASPPDAAAVNAAREAGTCPLLDGGLCGAHRVRPMGCRVFFCDRAATEWQHELYERCQTAIRRLHDDHGVAYRYGEWREMLALCATNTAAHG